MSRELLETTTVACGSYELDHGIALVAVKIKAIMGFSLASQPFATTADVKRSQGVGRPDVG